MGVEVYVFPDDHDEGKEDVDEFDMLEVDLLYVEELVLVYAVCLLQFLLQFLPSYPVVRFWAEHLLDNCDDILRNVRK